MIHRLFFILFIAVLWLATASLPAAEPDPRERLATWLAAQTNVQTWSAEFVQVRQFKSLTQPLSTPGRIWFAAPDRFRWELGVPAQTIAVRQTNQILVVYPKMKRVERYDLQAPEAARWRDALTLFEAGFPRSRADLDARFKLLSALNTNGLLEVTLEPKAPAARKLIPRLQLDFDLAATALHSTTLHLADGSVMETRFTNAVLNPRLADDVFSPAVAADFKETRPLNH
jgi:outer membrane lipoprotein-sorting protein